MLGANLSHRVTVARSDVDTWTQSVRLPPMMTR